MGVNKFYHSTLGLNTAIVTCRNKDSTFKLYYHLFDNPVQHIWQGLHINNNKVVSSDVMTLDFENLTSELKRCCKLENVSDIPDTFDQPYLNKLHNFFVLSNKNKTWIRINDLIHSLESKIDNPFGNYDSTIKFYQPIDQHITIPEEYKIFLNTDIKWGRMSLGYGTLGKDWFDIVNNNDTLDDLAIQTTISSETNLAFCVEPGIPGKQEVKLYRWAQEKENIPLDNLNQLALGRYPLGQLIITDTFLNFHNNPSDWYVPNHKCKLHWNKNIFTNVVVEEINFANTDMLYESFVRHGDLEDLFNA